MAQRIYWFSGIPSTPNLKNSKLRRNHFAQYRCCVNSNKRNNRNNYASSNYRETEMETETPQILKIVVSGVTELLRLLSPSKQTSDFSEDFVKLRDEYPVASVDDVLKIIESDYDKAYFVTGNFTSSIYAENCIFEDPTIKFSGTELYARNLKLLVPFFDSASIRLQKIEKDADSDTNFVLATWNLRTSLKLPWRPLILIDGKTYYELDEDFKIVRHVESWNVSALEAILQIFSFKSGNSGG